ncbi:hypothetical protein NVP1009O_38 [Vibrio phage 1.009.O._10N.261.51.C9]|nr:hypothetical protein NVP1009O_38 [Vibrio phage 1.009.O._10N.261.51.C9]
MVDISNRQRVCKHLHAHSNYCVKIGAKCLLKRWIGRSDACLIRENKPLTPPRPPRPPIPPGAE